VIVAPGIGETFVVRSSARDPEVRIRVVAGWRQNARAAGGDRSDRDIITLEVSYEAVTRFSISSSWAVESGGASAAWREGVLQQYGFLDPGDVATRIVTFHEIQVGVPVVLVYEGQPGSEPVFRMTVAP